jgi:ABC-type branched-subunit amino acid transport system ATPase component
VSFDAAQGSTLHGENSKGTILFDGRGIKKAYDGVQALKGLDFTLRAGEVHGLCGENGSGKSTLLKIISAQILPDEGTLSVGGDIVHMRTPNDSLAVGIGTVTQERTLVPDLTVAENIYLSHRKSRKWWGIDWKQTQSAAQDILNKIGCDVDINATVADIAPGDAQMVEIARALIGDIRILILDEPTSSLTSHEVTALFVALRNLTAHGVSVVFISHRMEEIFDICDYITVIRDGELISDGRISEYDRHRLVFEMIGREPSEIGLQSDHVQNLDVVLELNELTVANKFSNVSLKLGQGEILGLIGLVGAGHSELLSTLFGSFKESSGDISVHGKNVKIRTPTDAMGHGIAFVPADRKRQGLVLGMTVLENAIMASTSQLSRFTPPSSGNSKAFTEKSMIDFDISAPSLSAPISSLSGGNQQKVLLTKWLGTQPKILLLDEPTRGVDVGAKSEIYKILLEQREKGLSILVSSSEVPELLTLCDRILVMHRGSIVANLPRESADESKILQYAMGEG